MSHFNLFLPSGTFQETPLNKDESGILLPEINHQLVVVVGLRAGHQSWREERKIAEWDASEVENKFAALHHGSSSGGDQ